MLRRFLPFLLLIAGALPAHAEKEWFGIYLQGKKLGYSWSDSKKDSTLGKELELRESATIIQSEMMGNTLQIDVLTQTWVSPSGIVRSDYKSNSGGRIFNSRADFQGEKITVVTTTGSSEEKKTLNIPKDVRLIDDTMAISNDDLKDTRKTVVFDPTTVSLVEIKISSEGKHKIESRGGQVEANKIVVDDPRAKMILYVNDKGEMIRAEGPLGMTIIPEPENVAKDMTTGSNNVPDLAAASSIPVDGRIEYAAAKTELEVTGVDLSKSPSGGHQKIEKSGDGWKVTITPIRKANTSTKIDVAAKQQPNWTEPDTRIPSDKGIFRLRAQQMIGSETRVIPAAQKIRKEVLQRMRVNLGIGVMRDASEIWDSSEGVCRDHAILMATLLRSVNIPTKLVTGLVYYQGSFLYHAWVEVWDGQQWVGLDSTRPDDFLTAGHLKTAEGTVGQAMVGFLLDGAKVKVISPDVPFLKAG